MSNTPINSNNNTNNIYNEYIKNLIISFSAKTSEDIKQSEKALNEIEPLIFPNFREILTNLSKDENPNLTSKIHYKNITKFFNINFYI
jgi:hypothetical protein